MVVESGLKTVIVTFVRKLESSFLHPIPTLPTIWKAHSKLTGLEQCRF